MSKHRSCVDFMLGGTPLVFCGAKRSRPRAWVSLELKKGIVTRNVVVYVMNIGTECQSPSPRMNVFVIFGVRCISIYEKYKKSFTLYLVLRTYFVVYYHTNILSYTRSLRLCKLSLESRHSEVSKHGRCQSPQILLCYYSKRGRRNAI